MIHKVKKPFYCRHDQFRGSGYPAQILVIGVLATALTGETHSITIGRSKKVLTANTAEIKAIGQGWMNRDGKIVLIAPVELFKERLAKIAKT